MSECCASGSCEVCRPAAYGYPIQRREWAKWQAMATRARVRGNTDAERYALDELILLEHRYGAKVFEGACL